MCFGVQIEVWGEYALFTRPELKVERMSYDVMTPSAARGLVEAIYWHPGILWRIDRIHVLHPIRFTSVRRNEMKSKASAWQMRRAMFGGEIPALYTREDITQRSSTVLQDVRYVIDAHFELTDRCHPGDNPGKFKDIVRRRLEGGRCYHMPCFGCREFPAHFRPWDGARTIPVPEELRGQRRELGLMLYDMDYQNPRDIKPMFFRAELVDGCMEVAGREVFQ